MNALWHDVRYSVKSLARHPALACTGVIVLALAIGVNTAIFSVVNAVLFRPLAVHAPHDLRYIYTVRRTGGMPDGRTLYREFLELREKTTVFTDVLLASVARDKVRVNGNVDTAAGETVSANYFDVLGVRPLVGRPFAWEDDRAAGAPVAIVSHDFWQSRFNGDPEVLGKTIELTRSAFGGTYNPWRAYTVIGVMPPGFKGLSTWEPTQYWLPFLQHAAATLSDPRYQRRPESRRSPLDFAGLPVARLKPGVSDPQARAEVAALAQEFRREYHGPSPDSSLVMFDSRRVRLPFDPGGRIVPSRLAAALMFVSGVLLLIAAANLAGMLMARSVSRRTEIAVRLALGAGRRRLTGQLVTESLLLSFAGGLVALGVARVLVDLFIAGTPTQFVRWQLSALSLDVPIDARVLLVAGSSGVATGLLVGLISARQTLRTDVLPGLNAGFGSTRAVRGTLGRWVVIPQICLSLVLLLVAGVLVRTLIQAELTPPGYEAAGVVLLDFELPQGRVEQLKDPEIRSAFQRRLLERVSASQEVAAVALTATTPVTTLPLPDMRGWVIPREGFRPDGKHYWTAMGTASSDYFRTLQIPLLRGRAFDRRDTLESQPVAIVSEDLARLIWPDQDPIGRYLAQHYPDSSYPPKWMEVVGVARDVAPPLDVSGWNPAIYVPLEQQNLLAPFTLAARGRSTPAAVIQTLQSIVSAVEPQAITARGRTFESAVGEMLYPRRVAAAILGLAGAIGLVLASAGLYGLISFSVAQRLREIGVRLALGADGRDIRRMILREGLSVTATGTVLGFALTYAAIRLTSRYVAPLPPADALTFMAVPLLLGAVILLACSVPAARAARVDPIEVLRAL